MSFVSGTQTELLYASNATGTQLNTFTTEDNLQKTLPPVTIPAAFWLNPGATSKSLKIRAWGRLGTTAAPTFTWTLRFLTSTTWTAGGIVFNGIALTAGNTVTLAPWLLEIDVTLRTLGAPALSTLYAQGWVASPLGLASPFAGTIPGSNGTNIVTNFDATVTQYPFLSAACGTNNALNLIQLESLKVFGEN